MIRAISLEGAGQQELLRELNQHLETYDTRMSTGNSALDALLSDTWKKRNEKQIRWTCLADGSAVEHLAPVDLFLMLGNVLDNAMEGAGKETDPDKRYLNVNIWRKGRLAFVRVENNCPEAPSFENGIPVTTKTDPGHGFGMSSIRTVCQQYQGHLELKYEAGAFRLSIMLPLPAEAATPEAPGNSPEISE